MVQDEDEEGMEEDEEDRLHEAVETVGDEPPRLRPSLSPPLFISTPSCFPRATAAGPGLVLGLGVSPMDTKERPKNDFADSFTRSTGDTTTGATR